MTTPLNYHDLIENLTAPGCAVCRLVLRDVDHYLDSLLYEYVNDANTHRAFRSALGLCNTHGWQLLRYMGGSLGVAILYRAALDEVLKIMDHAPAPGSPPSGLARLLGAIADAGGIALADNLEPAGQCPVCAFMVSVEARYVGTFVDRVTEPRLREAFEASDGLCLPHFRHALRATVDAERIQIITAIQHAIWVRLKGELEEFQEKSGQDRRDEPMGAEGDSWQRVIGRMGGEKGVFGLDRRPA
jgi:hypothetical protein